MTTPTILIVDDHPLNRRLLEAWLSKQGYQIDCAQHGGEAFAKLKQADKPYHLVLMDINMPIMDGFEATRRLRQWESEQQRPPIPVIAVTTGGEGVTRTTCLAAGMDELVMKPVNLLELEETIQQLLCR